MDDATLLLWIGAAGAGAAILLLRRAWGKPARSMTANAAAWGLLGGALLCGAMGAGAWGLAVVTLCASLAAFLCLAHAAISTPPGRKTAASKRRVHMLPEKGEPLHLGARLLTFLLTVPGALIATLAVTLAIRGVVGRLGVHDANGNALTLLLMPLIWAVLVTLLLMQARRRDQYLLLGLPAVAGILILAATGAGA